jgi:probable rRNA maturation factor
MIDIEIEDEAWGKALPDCENLALKAAAATLQILPRRGRGTAEGGGGGSSEPEASETGPLRHGFAAPPPTEGEDPGDEDQTVVVLLTDDETVRDLNARFRGKDSATNVLSFPAHDTAQGHLGDICLAYGVCAREADEQGKTLAAHLQHLVAHGVLHLVGYDHEDDTEAKVMEDLERRILATLGLADPYEDRQGS